MLSTIGFQIAGQTKTFQWEFLGTVEGACLFLFGISLARFFLQILANHSVFFASEIFNAKQKFLAVNDYIFDLIKTKHQTSNLFFRFTEIIPRSGVAVNSFAVIVTTGIQCLTLYGAMFHLAWRETLVASFGLVMVAITTKIISKAISKVNQAIPEESRILSHHIQRASRNNLLFKILRTQIVEYQKLTVILKNYSGLMLRSQYLSTIAGSLAGLIGLNLIAVIMYFSVFWQTSANIFVMFLYLFTRLVQNLSTISTHYAQVQSSKTQFRMAFDYFLSLTEGVRREGDQKARRLSYRGAFIRDDHAPLAASGTEFYFSQNHLSGPPEISFEKVGFRYSDTSTSYLFHNFNLNIRSGEHIGIVGASGTGKSTLLMLLLGVIDPSEGKVVVSGMSPAQYFNKAGGRVGYVGAEPFLFAGTIRENLVYGIHRVVSQAEIRDALEFVNLSSLISDKTLNFHIAEDLAGLSSGQKQRLCLARAILCRPLLLILDEASANIDSETETDISKAISQLKEVTVVSVSHRENFLKRVNRTISLDSGRRV